MKKMMALLMIMATITVTSMATPGPEDLKISRDLLKRFQKAFPQAEQVAWEKVGEFYAVNFLNGDDKLTAYFEEEGDIYKVTRYIDCKNLPMAISQALNEQYGQVENKTVMEVTRDKSTYYLISFEYKDRKYIVQAEPHGQLDVVRKIKI